VLYKIIFSNKFNLFWIRTLFISILCLLSVAIKELCFCHLSPIILCKTKFCELTNPSLSFYSCLWLMSTLEPVMCLFSNREKNRFGFRPYRQTGFLSRECFETTKRRQGILTEGVGSVELTSLY
jgi:hypothetical protein